MDARRIRLEADFHTEGIWQDGPGEWDEIDPTHLPISESLRADLGGWRDRWDAILDIQYPPDSRFNSPEDECAFVLDGERLRMRLQQELGLSWYVAYRTGSPIASSLLDPFATSVHVRDRTPVSLRDGRVVQRDRITALTPWLPELGRISFSGSIEVLWRMDWEGDQFEVVHVVDVMSVAGPAQVVVLLEPHDGSVWSR